MEDSQPEAKQSPEDLVDGVIKAAEEAAAQKPEKLEDLTDLEFRSRCVSTLQEIQKRLEALTSEFRNLTGKVIELSDRCERNDSRVERVDVRIDKLERLTVETKS